MAGGNKAASGRIQALACGGYIMLIRDDALWNKELWSYDGSIVSRRIDYTL
jgi:hypothetical protein